MTRLCLLLLAGVVLVRADTPANCLYEDIKGTWIIEETDRIETHEVSCDELTSIVHTKHFTLAFPNTVTDELGNAGTWTLIYNQGFEININERSYFAFSYYEGDFSSSVSYCDRTFNGWARDTTVRNWSCFKATKATTVTPRITNKVKPLPKRNFVNDLDLIDRINSAQSNWTAKAYPQFEKYTLEEMMRRAGGPGSVLTHPAAPAPASEELKKRVILLPSEFDWRDIEGVNYVTPVRDQAQCGSCYVFASIAALEARLRIATQNHRTDIFSTQDPVSCSNLAQGCAGGFNYLIAGRHAMEQGVVSDYCNEYMAIDEMCDTDMTCRRTYVSDYSYVGGFYGACNEELMMEALVQNGPMAVSYMVYSDFFGYEGGIYHHTGLKGDFNPLEIVSHAVLLVGYGVEDGEKFWSVKNSWGGDWGEEGFFRIRRGTNECSIESAAFESTIIP